MDFTWNSESLLIDTLYKQEMNQLAPLYRQEHTNLICFYLSIIENGSYLHDLSPKPLLKDNDQGTFVITYRTNGNCDSWFN